MSQTTSYSESLLAELEELEQVLAAVVAGSGIKAMNWDPGFIFPPFAWMESGPELVAARMDALRKVKDLELRFRLLFPHPTPEVSNTLKESFGLMKKWMKRGRSSDWDLPGSIAEAGLRLSGAVKGLRDLMNLVPTDEWKTRLVPDTNILLDEPDLSVHRDQLGPRYLVHVVPTVFREIDDLKRNGRNQDVREAAKRVDRRLKGLRDNGDVSVGARVAGDVFAVFDHKEPRGDGLPDWLDLEVPDDRLVASALLLQSEHPGSRVVVATGDMNMQNKLAAVGLPFVELA